MERERPGNGGGDQPMDAEQEGVVSNRRVLGVFAMLLALVIIILAGGLVLVRRLRPPADLQPIAIAQTATTSPAAGTMGTISATATPPAAATPSPTMVPTVVATPTLAPTATILPEATATATAVLPIRPETPPPGATIRGSTVIVVPASPSAQRVAVVDTIDPKSPLVPELVTAYLHYWDIRTQAFHTVDPTRLPEVLADPELGFEQARISQLRALGRAVRLQGEHSISVVVLTPDSAVLVDQFANRSVAIDLATGQEVSELAPALQKLVYTLRKIDGAWKVVEVQQQ